MYADFDTSKIRPGEPVAILGNDPSVPSGKALYIAFAANDVRRLCSIEDILEMVNAGEFVGPQGPKGEKGDKGADGTVAFESLTPEQKESLRGISIKSASVDTDGNLTITFSDGDSKDVGNIMGPQGIQGPKGDKGDVGPQGLKGDKGDVGPKGDNMSDKQAAQIEQNKTDIASLKKETGSLKEDLSTKITKFYASSQGENHLADSDNGKIQDMMVYGKSEQKQYSGKNLFDKSTSKSAWISDDGIYIEKGEIGENTDVVSTYIGVKENSTYIASFKTNYNTFLVYWCTYNANKEFVSITKIVNKITIPTGIRYVRVMISMQQQYCVAVNDELQVELGTEATAYEPYTGGQPSPSPDYPQEIKSVANPTVKVCGKNLLNPTLFKDYLLTMHGVTCKSVTDETGSYFLLDGTADSETDFWIQGNTVFTYDGSADKLTISVREACPDSYYLCVGRLEKDFRNTKAVTTSLKSFSFYIHVLKGAVINNYRIYVQVEVGDIATDYEPYHEQTVTLPYTLNAIPVSSGGNVTIDGQQYISDYVDVERGKLVRMCKEVDFTTVEPSEYLNSLSVSREARYLYSSLRITPKTVNVLRGDGDGYMTSLSRVDVGIASWNMDVLGVWQHGQGDSSANLVIRVPNNIGATEYLKSIGGCKGIFISATSEEIDLTPEEIAAFKALTTYYPTTNIFINSEQLDGYTVFNYPISMKNGWDYVKKQLNDNRDYIYNMDTKTQDIDTQAAEAYVNSEYAVALTELEV